MCIRDSYKDKEYHYYYCPTGKKNGCTSSVMVKESDLIECVQGLSLIHIFATFVFVLFLLVLYLCV